MGEIFFNYFSNMIVIEIREFNFLVYYKRLGRLLGI